LMSRAGLSRFHPKAAVILMLAANVPDIDVGTLALGRVEYLHYHRAITHALVMLPVMAGVAVLLSWPFVRPGPLNWRAAFPLALLGAISHLLLDWTNIYGIRLLLPFDSTWYNLSSTHVFDLWIWGVYGLALFWPMLSKLVSSEIGAKSTAGRGIAIMALLFVVLYDSGRAVLQKRVVALQSSRIYEGQAPRQVLAIPGPTNPLSWRGLVETESAFYISNINLLFDFDPTAAQPYYKPERIPAKDALLSTWEFRVLTDFSTALLFRNLAEPEPPGTVRVEAVDLRFGDPASTPFRLSAIVDSAGRLVKVIP
jgi:inner membrane protein